MNKKYFKGIWHFAQAVNLANAFLGKKMNPVLKSRRNLKWRRLIFAEGAEREKLILDFKKDFDEDRKVIAELQKKMADMKVDTFSAKRHEKGVIAQLAWEVGEYP